MKKLISIAVAAVMIAGVAATFVGCGDKEFSTEIDWNVDLSKPITLKGLFPNAGMKNFGKDDTAEIIQRETGYEVEYKELASKGAEDAVGKYLSSHETFNFMKLNDACYTPYLDGTFVDLKDLLEKTPEGQVLYQLINLMDNGWDAVKYVDEKGVEHIYGIPDFGYVHMIDHALIWNTNHLEQIGFETEFGHTLPETLGEVTWAFEKLQDKFGSNSSYHAFGIPGAAAAEVTPIAACFEVPNNFYVDENGKIQIKNYSPNMADYVMYMNYLYEKGIISSQWNGSSAATANQAFGDELHSCIYLPYWNVTALVNAIVAKDKIAKTMGVTNNFQTMHDEAIAWTLRIRGDGSSVTHRGQTIACKDQEKALLPGDPGGISYYTVIPYYMAKNARHVINYLAKKMEAFATFFGGDEGKHWNALSEEEIAERDLPKAEVYTEETDALYTAKESFKDKILFVRPYHYSYTDARSGEEKTVEVNEPGKWIRLTERYPSGQIAENSQYCTGTNAIAAKVYCHLHELGFNAWYYCDNNPDPEEWISNPMFMSPVMKLWGPVNIITRSHFLTGVETAISAKADPNPKKDQDPLKILKVNLDSARTKKAPNNGKSYYYWSDAISDEMTAWYNSSKNKA